jgi:hypothetical protein
MSSKQKLLVKIIIAFFIICILLVIAVGLFKNRKLSYTEIEEKLISSAKKYYEDNENLLPEQDGGSVSVDSMTLIEQNYMKEFSKYKKAADTCSGKVTVTNNNSHYLYIPTLTCQEYQTTSLYEKILSDQEIVEDGDGLYAIGEDYVYRGEYPNNYVVFANKTWRILRLTSSKEIRLIQVDSYQETPWDNRYNVNANYSAGISDYEISRIKDKIDSIYAGETDFSDVDKSYIVSKQLCIGSRNKKETTNDGTIECSKLTENAYPLGMLQVNEYVVASIDQNCKLQTDASCTNYNYLTKLESNFWTITPSNENNYEVYYIYGMISSSVASEFKPLRIVLNIDGTINYKSGDGTVENPYVITKK